MGYFRYPAYYARFKCIASACTDSCCQNWEIDIDDETWEYYRQVQGEFGQRLKEHIAPAVEETGDPAHFIQVEQERCPFLNKDNLCDIFIHEGEEHLSWICTHHPRYYDWFIQGREAGVGMCCEAATALILEKTGYPEFIEEQEEEEFPEEEQEEAAIEKAIFALRSRLFHTIKPEQPMSVDEMMNELYRQSFVAQGICDDLLFPEEEGSEEDVFSEEELSADEFCGEEYSADTLPGVLSEKQIRRLNWTESFFTEEFLQPLLDFYLGLEINDGTWWILLNDAKKQLPELLSRRREFLAFYREKEYEYSQLLIYFLYRHFMKCREDGMVYEWTAFALISVCMIELLDVMHWRKYGELTAKQQIDICKLYSKEIEYDEENTEKVAMYLG